MYHLRGQPLQNARVEDGVLIEVKPVARRDAGEELLLLAKHQATRGVRQVVVRLAVVAPAVMHLALHRPSSV